MKSSRDFFFFFSLHSSHNLGAERAARDLSARGSRSGIYTSHAGWTSVTHRFTAARDRIEWSLVTTPPPPPPSLFSLIPSKLLSRTRAYSHASVSEPPSELQSHESETSPLQDVSLLPFLCPLSLSLSLPLSLSLSLCERQDAQRTWLRYQTICSTSVACCTTDNLTMVARNSQLFIRNNRNGLKI